MANYRKQLPYYRQRRLRSLRPCPRLAAAQPLRRPRQPLCRRASIKVGSQADGGAPFGCNVVIPASSPGGNYNLGQHISLALDENDDPLIAYVVQDPNGDGEQTDSTLYFVRWDRANRGWKAPIAVDVVGEIYSSKPAREVSLARDVKTNGLGIAYMKGLDQIWLAQSQDGGSTWSKERLDQNEFTIDNPVLAMRDGNVHVAYNSRFVRCGKSGCDGVVYLSRTGTSGNFARSIVPEIAGTSGNRRFSPPGLALDSSGKPGLAYYLLAPSENPSVDKNVISFWRPGEQYANAVMDSGSIPNDNPSVSLAFDGTRPRIAALLQRDDNDLQHPGIWFSASEDGKSWSAPVRIPNDGTDNAVWDLSLALDSQGNAAAAGYSNGFEEKNPGRCGGPKLFRSADLKNWTACGADVSRTYDIQGRYVSLAFTSTNKIILAFQNTSQSKLGAGVFLYRQP